MIESIDPKQVPGSNLRDERSQSPDPGGLPGLARLPHNHRVPSRPHSIQIKRAYEKAKAGDGARFLVDRLWPRGITKERLAIEGWLKDVAPSNELRHWYHSDLDQWAEFRKRYFKELAAHQDACVPLIEAARNGTITLLFGSKQLQHNNAIALKEFLEQRLARDSAQKRERAG